MTIKIMGKKSQDEVVNFFIGFGKEDLVYDTTGVKEHEIFESLRNYIERVFFSLFRTESPKTILSLIRSSSRSTGNLLTIRIRAVWREETKRSKLRTRLKPRQEPSDKSSLKI